MATSGSPARCAVLVGPYSSGKTTLLEAMLYATGDIRQKGSINNGSTVGDASPEARARVMSVEPNFAHASYLGDDWSFIDCPGSVELANDAHNCLMVADVAVIVAEPDPDRFWGPDDRGDDRCLPRTRDEPSSNLLPATGCLCSQRARPGSAAVDM